jgi:hypothetical protein
MYYLSMFLGTVSWIFWLFTNQSVQGDLGATCLALVIALLCGTSLVFKWFGIFQRRGIKELTGLVTALEAVSFPVMIGLALVSPESFPVQDPGYWVPLFLVTGFSVALEIFLRSRKLLGK